MYDVIIIGAGPSGLMCSNVINKDKKMLIIEKNSTPGKKLLLTGGGRCNITNNKSVRELLEEINYNKKYLYSTLSKFGPSDIINYFNNNSVYLKEEKENRIYPKSNKAEDILNCLVKNINEDQIHYKEELIEVIPGKIITIKTNKSEYKTNNLVISSGGASFKVTGSTGDHIKLADSLEQPIISLFPAEVGIILEDKMNPAGTAFDNVIIKYGKKKTYGNLMVTHRGLSGDSIMRMSEYLYKGTEKVFYIDFMPAITEIELQEVFDELINVEVISFLKNYVSKRFAEWLIEDNNLKRKLKSYSEKEKNKLFQLLKNYQCNLKAVGSIDEAYVTGGGIDLDFINMKTMESKIHSGIYFVGECLDIHGPIGGYNLTLALSTGYAAGSDILNK